MKMVFRGMATSSIVINGLAPAENASTKEKDAYLTLSQSALLITSASKLGYVPCVRRTGHTRAKPRNWTLTLHRLAFRHNHSVSFVLA